MKEMAYNMNKTVEIPVNVLNAKNEKELKIMIDKEAKKIRATGKIPILPDWFKFKEE